MDRIRMDNKQQNCTYSSSCAGNVSKLPALTHARCLQAHYNEASSCRYRDGT